MILPIVLHPNKILRQKTRDLGKGDIELPETQQLIDDMIETMRGAKGVGLAAPQIDSDLRLTVVEVEEGNPQVFINPYIVGRSLRKVVGEEGCLSIPGIYGTVKRSKKVTVKYLDQHGKKQTIKADDLLSRVLQHEIDHLEGVLFIDKIEKYTNNKEKSPEYPHK